MGRSNYLRLTPLSRGLKRRFTNDLIFVFCSLIEVYLSAKEPAIAGKTKEGGRPIKVSGVFSFFCSPEMCRRQSRLQIPTEELMCVLAFRVERLAVRVWPLILCQSLFFLSRYGVD